MSDFICDKCGGSFATQDGLESHKKDKHPQPSPQKKSNLLVWIVLLLAILLFLWSGLKYLNRNGEGDCFTQPPQEMDIGEHENLALHIHPELQIIILSEEQIIPADIGVSNAFMRPIHTHKTDGVLHVEAPCQRDFTLADFFVIWGKQLNQTCIFSFCNSETNELKVTINGEESQDFLNYPMKDGDKIIISYGEPQT